ncbi:hypothetical protein A5699_26290 [Mycobacterium sp. E802]|uniref:hypothetical protein n=1 Tax=Mycobacterium sp. E802 TaxID=1834152 RepID=UPI0007FC5417|nr:hypothetical protein [Mycobacterium sp. E802]OBG84717.1 hypothetical protein A5699_26290 [Mycobacterium sp. E802]
MTSAAVEEPVEPAATPEIRLAVVEFLRMLVTTAVDVVIELASQIHAIFNFPWATGAVSAVQSLTALPYHSIVTLLQKIKSHALLLPAVGSPIAAAAADALKFDLSLDEIVSLSSVLQRTAPVLADVSHPGNAKTTPLKKAVTALVAISLWALLSTALPGLGGVFAAAVTGVRIGYRQAKWGVTLRTTELARFARQGPIGTVRSGSLIAVHTRTARPGPTARREQPQLVA